MAIDQNELRHFTSYLMDIHDNPPPPKKNQTNKLQAIYVWYLSLCNLLDFSEDQRVGCNGNFF